MNYCEDLFAFPQNPVLGVIFRLPLCPLTHIFGGRAPVGTPLCSKGGLGPSLWVPYGFLVWEKCFPRPLLGSQPPGINRGSLRE